MKVNFKGAEFMLALPHCDSLPTGCTHIKGRVYDLPKMEIGEGEFLGLIDAGWVYTTQLSSGTQRAAHRVN